jgi:hypothetical protein
VVAGLMVAAISSVIGSPIGSLPAIGWRAS